MLHWTSSYIWLSLFERLLLQNFILFSRGLNCEMLKKEKKKPEKMKGLLKCCVPHWHRNKETSFWPYCASLQQSRLNCARLEY